MAWTIDMTGKNTLVTGGATGIGAQTCRELAEAGCNVAVNYYPSERDRAAAKELLEELRAMGVKAEGYEADVSSEEQVNAMVEKVVADFGSLEKLFSNAGNFNKCLMHEMDLAEWRRITSVHLDGAFLVAKACVVQMLKQGEGDIVFMASGCGLNGGGGSVAYPAAKAGIEGMMHEMVNEYASKGIRVNCIRPMVIETPMTRGRYDDAGWEHYLCYLPAKKAGTPKNVADLVVFLLDRERSEFILGASINIDGGRILHQQKPF